MTVLRLLRLRRPADFADWYRIGAEYVHDVAAGMGLRVGDFESRVVRATDAMRAGRTDLPPDLARSVAADLLADAAFCDPFCQWMPLWYELGLAAPCAYADYRLRRVAEQYADDLPLAPTPHHHTPVPSDALLQRPSAPTPCLPPPVLPPSVPPRRPF